MEHFSRLRHEGPLIGGKAQRSFFVRAIQEGIGKLCFRFQQSPFGRGAVEHYAWPLTSVTEGGSGNPITEKQPSES